MLYTTNTTMLKWIIGSFAMLMAFVGFGSANLSVTGVFVYDADFIPPTGYLKLIDDTSNPQLMVMMEKENSSTLYDFTGMQAYTPPAGYAIPSNALKGLLISSNGSITWIYTGDDGFIDIGGYSDWVIDPQDDLSNYQLFSADGFVNNDNDNSSKYFVSMNRGIGMDSKIRLVYTSGRIATEFAAGSGTLINPYQISICEHWQNINNHLTSYFELTQDLDCRGIGNDVMIGSSFPTFQGSVDGNGYTISYEINSTDENMGLFRVLQGATIQNLGLSGSVISTDDHIGGLAGYIQSESMIEVIFGTVYASGLDQVGGLVGTTAASNQSFSGIDIQGTVMGGGLGGNSRVGGIIGESFSTLLIDNSNFSGSVSADGDYVGGLAGSLNTGHINNSTFIGSVEGNEQVGGLIGILYDGSITNSSADVTVDAFNTAGGLIGNTLGVTITDSHATVDLSVSDSYGFLGGLVGQFEGSILRSYAIGTASGTEAVGGLVGGAYDSTISQSYADVDVSGDNEIGGLVGYIQGAAIYDSYALGDIYPNDNNAYAGGVIGLLNGGTGNNLFSVGEVHGSGDFIGGLIGGNNGTVTNSFRDTQTSTANNSEAGSGLFSIEMKSLSPFDDAGRWITTGTTDVNNGYPYLLWQENEIFDASGFVWFIVPRVDFFMYMTDNGPTTGEELTHTFSLQFLNHGLTPVNDAGIRLMGPIASGAATVRSGVAFNRQLSGEYIEWAGISLDGGERVEFVVDITLPEAGAYVFTANIRSATYQDDYERNNTFTVFSTYESPVVEEESASRSNGGGGGSSRKDSCPAGDYSSSFYDNNCGDTDTKVDQIIAKLQKKWAAYDTSRIESILNIIQLLNTEIQSRDVVSDAMKELLNVIIIRLVEIYG